MKMFVHALINTDDNLTLQLTNDSSATVRSVEILTVFLKEQLLPGYPSCAHIRFAPVPVVRPHEMCVVLHKTWINGKPVAASDDQLGRLETREGSLKPYVLDISWEDATGKTNFQRIPVGYQ